MSLPLVVEAIAEEADAADVVKPVLVETTGPAAAAAVEMVAAVEVVTTVGVMVAADPPMADMAEAPATATLVDQAVEDKVGGEETTRAINPLALFPAGFHCLCFPER